MTVLLKPKNLLWHITGFFVFGLIIIFPYLQAEILTASFDDLGKELKTICQKDLGIDNPRLKILSYRRSQKTIRAYCLSPDRNKDREILFNYTNKWEPVLVQDMQAKQSFYWPIYPF